jgi:hypothetical protein
MPRLLLRLQFAAENSITFPLTSKEKSQALDQYHRDCSSMWRRHIVALLQFVVAA